MSVWHWQQWYMAVGQAITLGASMKAFFDAKGGEEALGKVVAFFGIAFAVYVLYTAGFYG